MLDSETTEEPEVVAVAPDAGSETEVDEQPITFEDLVEAVPDEYPEVNGDCLVTLQVRVPEVYGDPSVAVYRAMTDFIETGLGKYVFMVTDLSTEETYAIQDGETLTPEQMKELLE